MYSELIYELTTGLMALAIIVAVAAAAWLASAIITRASEGIWPPKN